ncbi:hypothetical protein [Priestia megaterium]|nr:hypothetical protein [Priestia megaterium]
MKIVWISALLLGCLMGFSIGVDMMQGFSFFHGLAKCLQSVSWYGVC